MDLDDLRVCLVIVDIWSESAGALFRFALVTILVLPEARWGRVIVTLGVFVEIAGNDVLVALQSLLGWTLSGVEGLEVPGVICLTPDLSTLRRHC